jgi:hypothetical protein
MCQLHYSIIEHGEKDKVRKWMQYPKKKRVMLTSALGALVKKTIKRKFKIKKDTLLTFKGLTTQFSMQYILYLVLN